jgi:peptidoglycan DL-endopeptidase CwlO
MQLGPIAQAVRFWKQSCSTAAAALVPSKPAIAAAEAAARVCRRQVPLVLLSLVAALASATAADADPSLAAKRAEAEQVLAQVQQLDRTLAFATQAYDRASLHLHRVRDDIRKNTRRLAIASTNLRRGQRQLSVRVVELYVSGQEDSTLEVFLGAASVDDLVNRIDGADRVAEQDARILRQLMAFRAEVQRRQVRLREARREVSQLVAERAAARASVETQLSQRRQLLAAVREEVTRLEAQERARQAELRRQLEARLAAQKQQELAAALPVTPVSVSSAPPAPAPAPSRGNVVSIAMQYLGVPYVWGGASPSGFDCSGFTMYVYAQIGVSLPHYTGAQYAMGVPVSRSQLQPGDLVFFDGLGHEGLYIGNNQFIHAPHTGDVVKISSITGWYASTYVGARRV